MPTIDSRTTDDLTLCRQGDRAAFSRLVRRHHATALGLATRLMGNMDDGEDALQDALLKAWHGLDLLRDERGFGAWLLRIVYHQSLDARRRRDTRHRHESAGEGTEVSPPDVEASHRELLRRVQAAMAELPPRLQAALHLRVHEQLPHDELATVLGVTPGTARALVSRARRRLRDRLGDLLGPGKGGA